MMEPIPYTVAEQAPIDAWWYARGLVVVRFEYEGVGYAVGVPEEILEDEPALQGVMRMHIEALGQDRKD